MKKGEFMLYSLLSATDVLKTVGKILLWVVVIAAMFFMLFYLPNKREKARQEEESKKLAAIKVGTKIKTIGGIYGVIVEINDAENCFVIETGSEENKGYLKIDKRAVYDSDAVVPEESTAAETETPVEAEAQNDPSEEPFEETSAAEETPAEEAVEPVEAETTEENAEE